ncbi:MG2 domain-containing protein [Lysobacter sp. CFH 32150]|uniref:MG2 domain-containing protein n=1 Tax=Lysobacter sp. CFH 32150 TaxID=2927128 RepID=UPI001FA6C374|nr:MG2 domain-containing protein [Lysobacter sp. CFH 32150]MCI4566526.1 alpha-2-macroglobulin family protein [Lysobacter sp. CFH 32150]
MQRIFGQVDWVPPGWLSALVAKVRTRPRLYLGSFAALIVVAGLGWWLATRPTPVIPGALDVSVHAPDLTDYTKTPATIDTLRVSFSGSAAPIEKVGSSPEGIVLQPEIKGTWSWTDDQTLVFTPAGDWPVGQTYTLTIDAKRAIAPKVHLAEDEFEFSTAAFTATLAKSEFYQDPVDANLKKGVYELAFSHPVDAAQLERRIVLHLNDGGGTKLAAPSHTVTYDERRLKAWIHSQPLQLPENGGTLKLVLAQGVSSLLGGDGTKDAINGTVTLPSLYSVDVTGVIPTLVDNERFEPEQVLVLEFNNAMRDTEVANAVKVWLLPSKNAKLPIKDQRENYPWSEGEIDETLLKQSTLLALTPVPTEREYTEAHSFKFGAPPKRRLYVRVGKGLKAFGGFILGKNHATVATIPEYPQLLRFVGDGALLSLRGERRISIVSRNVPNARLEIARVLPEQLQHLAFANQGDYARPYLEGIEADSLVERVEKRMRLPAENPAKAHYEGVDLGEFLKPSRRGVFMLSLRTLSDNDSERPSAETLADDAGEEQDQRLVVLTDLGIIVKKSLDGSRDVFVQSLAQGSPVAGAQVRVIARNGETLVEAGSDGNGRARLPSLDDFRREKRPVMLTVTQGDDFSFLPIDDSGRVLDYSRFDIGGEPNDIEAGALNAFLFSDRGLYRPGDTINLGIIVRAADWKRPLTGLPLELVLSDPRGTVARRQRIKLGSVGFESFNYTPSDSAPSGTWEANLYLIGKDDRRTAIGSTSVQVREFAPDTMRVRAQFSSENPQGWIKPEDLSATVSVENLFGTPAQQRRVAATMVLRPAFPSFPAYPDYRFFDPQRAKEGYDETLTDATTDNDGHAKFAIDLKKYERATYQLNFLARAYEPGSGRNVAAQANALVSSNDHLVGIKAQDDLGYVKRGDKRVVQLLTIGQDGKPKQVAGLHAVVVEKRYVSVLTKQDSGLYRYVSHERRFDRRDQVLQLAGGRQTVTLPTDQPGEFVLEVRGSDTSKPLNEINFSVTGAANLSRSLEHNAELALNLSKPSYSPGETIEVSVRAPYPGSGLITLERDRVYAHVWFRADTTSSVQKVQVPADFEGNGYVNVQFLRDPNSDEIFMSPLSFGVVPFAVNRAARTQSLQVKVPAVAKPGIPVTADITTEGKARVLLFVVDEGILQVARYRVGDPLDHFFKKKMLQVRTAQILDLMLPEFSRLAALSAPGGDSEGDLAKHLNPFKRKTEKPAVWWSGIFDVDGRKQVKFAMPDHFNGQVRVVAVAVTAERIGLSETKAVIRGDFVLTPTVPTHVAPGDEFELPVGITNTIAGGKSAATVATTLQLPPSLTLVGAAPPAQSLTPGRETTVRFRLRAGNALGAAPIVVIAQSGKYRAQRRIELSLRPAIVARQDLRVGRADRRVVLKDLRSMFDQRATRQLSASVSPLVAIDGLTAYLAGYPHMCTEQLLSQALPALVLSAHPEFGKIVTAPSSQPRMDLVDVLRSRQNSEGGLGLWMATPDADPFVSGYAALYLLEARERGKPVPDDVLAALNRYLEAQAANRSGNDLAALRSRALAVYLLIRQGRTASNLLGAVHEQLKRDQPKTWENDVAGLFVAASYQLLQQDKAARGLASKAIVRANGAKPVAGPGYAYFYDPGIGHAWTVYLVNKHFQTMSKQLQAVALERLLDPLRNNSYNTLSSALTVLAMDAYATARNQSPMPMLQAAGKDGKARSIGVTVGQISRGTFTARDTQLWVAPADKTPAWYLLNQSGYDRVAPKAAQSNGLEVIRDYLDSAGKPVTTLTQGDEVTVRLRVRALGATARGDIAIVDLLPGGFEPVLQYPEAAAQAVATTSDESEYEGCEDCEEEGEESAQPSDAPPAPTLALSGSSFQPQHVEQREDRIVLYGFVSAQVSEFRYRVRANNSGSFIVPPIYAESMYERAVYAQGGPAGTLQVTAPKRP